MKLSVPGGTFVGEHLGEQEFRFFCNVADSSGPRTYSRPENLGEQLREQEFRGVAVVGNVADVGFWACDPVTCGDLHGLLVSRRRVGLLKRGRWR